MNPQEQVMQQMFKVQIAMMAHVIHSAYCVAIGEPDKPSFGQLTAPQQDQIIKNVEFWLANPDAPVGAGHENWLANAIGEGWRLSETLDPVGKFSPFIRPFDSLPNTEKVKEHLFRAAVKSVTYTQSEAPAYHARMQLIGAAVKRKFPDAKDATEASVLWNALSEEERQVEVDALTAERDAAVAKMQARNARVGKCIEHFGVTVEDWQAMSEEQRVQKLDEHGAITGEGDWYTPEEKAAIAKQDEMMARIANGDPAPAANDNQQELPPEDPQSLSEVVEADMAEQAVQQPSHVPTKEDPFGEGNAPL